MEHFMLHTGYLRSLTFIAVLAAAPIASAQTKVYGAYWEWPNIFHPNSTFSFYNGTGTNPQWNLSMNVPSGELWAYPASVRGYHYGYNPSGDTLFPKQLSTITSIPAAFSYAATQTTGGTNLRGDFTYDMFLRYDNGVSGNSQNPQLEVMVWGGNASYPISTNGLPIATSVYAADGYTWDLYYGYNSYAGYPTYSFVPHRTTVPTELPASGHINVDLRAFFTVLKNLNPGYYTESMYLDVVEAGCEVTQGDGYVQTTYFSVNAY
jgi:hypothetical protein